MATVIGRPHDVRDVGVAGSNPVTPTTEIVSVPGT